MKRGSRGKYREETDGGQQEGGGGGMTWVARECDWDERRSIGNIVNVW